MWRKETGLERWLVDSRDRLSEVRFVVADLILCGDAQISLAKAGDVPLS